MKVIVAGFSKTGTKTLNAALTELGYEVYDFLEHFWHHGENWNKILKYGGTVEDFKRMYEDVDAVCDVPACAFWEEIHEAFPDSKVSYSPTNYLSRKAVLGNQLPQLRRDLFRETSFYRKTPLGSRQHCA